MLLLALSLVLGAALIHASWNLLVKQAGGDIRFAMMTSTLAPLSQVAPAREVSMLFAAPLGGTLLREQDMVWRLLGAALIAGGVMALA